MQKVDLLLNKISQRSQLQKKHIENLDKDTAFFKKFEGYLGVYLKYCAEVGKDINFLADSYIKECDSFTKDYMVFLKDGTCPTHSVNYVMRSVYTKRKRMQEHLMGLFVTQFLWVNHLKINTFFMKNLKAKTSGIRRYLEAGAGHGLQLLEAMRLLKKSDIEVIDISAIAIEICKKIVEISEIKKKIRFYDQDIFNFVPAKKFDCIMLGEVLEHVENPKELLSKIRGLLRPAGSVFVSTCANCPAIDHVHIFKDARYITETIQASGFNIESELILPIGNMKSTDALNYAAILRNYE